MLEDFTPNEDKPKVPKGGDIIQPSAEQQPAQNTTTPPAGPYRPSILNQSAPTENKPAEPTTAEQTQPQAQDTSNPKQEATMQKPQQTATKSNKKKKLIIILLVLFLLGGGGAGWWFGFRESNTGNSTQNTPNTSSSSKTEPASKLVPAALSGLDVEAEIANKQITGIMIENSGEARPQSGLLEADVVFEAIAEGGITRFLALYQSKSPEYIGPVRSARPYYAEWVKTFDASYVHAGGSPDGLQTISSLGVKDISAFAYGDDVFFRTSDRQSPHNLYTSLKGLDKVNKEKGFTGSKFTPWSRKKDVPQTATAKKIDITISSAFYNPSYEYDAATNTYLRSQAGEMHKDEKSGKQIAPKTVLVMAMNKSQNGIYSVYKTNGSGKFYAFQDGQVTEGTWERSGVSDQYSFKDANGFNFLFNKGQTWVSIVSDSSSVKYTP